MPTAIIKLVAHKGDQLLVSYDLVPGEFQIGRDPACPITLDSPEVSRQHAQLTITPDRCILEDIGGKFGTLIDGRQIAGPVTIQPGQSFSIGKIIVTLLVVLTAFSIPLAIPAAAGRKILASGSCGPACPRQVGVSTGCRAG